MLKQPRSNDNRTTGTDRYSGHFMFKTTNLRLHLLPYVSLEVEAPIKTIPVYASGVFNDELMI